MYNKSNILKAYLDDYRKGFHVRGIAMAVKISPSAVSYMAKNMEKKRILNHEMEGRNKKYFINHDNPAAKNMLIAAELEKKTEAIEKHFIIKKLANEINFGRCIAVLFGSFAKNTANESSDIDILVLGDSKEIKNNIHNFQDTYSKKIHLISMSAKDFAVNEKREFVNEILKNHVVLNNTEDFVNVVWGIYYGAK